ncbi:hypothetical protein THAOC_35564 [Thalassiosira oceanica]|uniref:Uncharacterized protein n=1 Tax=Thalassiosira oceanica TaxID=159749 RepID=K0R364_THAOC|nr:hypothetical protein THAOC_35564 [Thalassiosira oceanica]|eukprot:EJK45804.1 hypothetical protein THAOC_35564 [Thalassiosira oceanica]
MLFRPPLHIDYSARAQDLIALDRENRKAACRIVPRVPGGDTDGVAGDGPSSSRGTAEQGSGRRREPGTDRGGAVSERPTGRIRSLLDTLGPAIAPSGDALRDVEGATGGPTRGRRLAVKDGTAAVLLGIGSSVTMVSNLALDVDDDLDVLGRWQSARTALRGSDFARMASRAHRPELARGRVDAKVGDGPSRTRLPRPDANLVADLARACERSVETDAPDYGSRLYGVPLAEFLDADGASRDGATLPALELRDLSIIRLDPTLDPVEANDERVLPAARMLRTVGEVYSAVSVMKQIRPPHVIRPKENGPKRKSFPVRRPQYAFLDDLARGSGSGRGSLEIDPFGCCSSDVPAFPRKITLDRDISLDTRHETIDEPCSVSPSLLPAFTSTLAFGGKKHASSDRPRPIASVRGVGSVGALAGVVGASSATCLFIPKPKMPSRRSEVEDKRREDETTRRETRGALISAVRSCVPPFTGAPGDTELLQSQCEQYPMKSWFHCDAGPNEPVHEDLLQIKRKAFCLHAKSKSSVEHARTCLATGSSSKRTLSGRYIYKSFLTNDKIEPKVFQRRYLAMLVMRRQTEPGGSCLSLTRIDPSDFYFVRTAMASFAEAFARKRTLAPDKKSTKAGKRGAVLSIKTKRHGIINLPSKKEPKGSTAESTSKEGREVFGTALVEAILSTYQGETAESSRDIMDSLMQVVEEDSLRIRGELLHLSDKAQALNDKSNGDESANKRGRVSTPPPPSSGEPCAPVASAGEKRKVEEAIDLTLDDEDGDGEKKEKKKKRKKQKKKKRQHADVDIPAEEESTSPRKRRRPLVEQSSNMPREEYANGAVGSKPIQVTIGVTPINPPSKRVRQNDKYGETAEEKDKPTVSFRENPNNTDKTLVEERSPASVSDDVCRDLACPSTADSRPLNLFKTPRTDGDSQLRPNASDANHDSRCSIQDTRQDVESRRDESGGEAARVEHQPYAAEAARVEHQPYAAEDTNRPPGRQFTLLTSERFLETFPLVVTEMATGRWVQTLTDYEQEMIQNANMSQSVVVADCQLVDQMGVDIELADGGGIIVQQVSSWQNREGGGYKAFLRYLVDLAASARYNHLAVVLCVDTVLTDGLSQDILTIQNSVICHCNISFDYCAPRTFASAILLRVASSTESSPPIVDIGDVLSDFEVLERVRFLLDMIPLMTVHQALRVLGQESGLCDTSGAALNELFRLARESTSDQFPHNVPIPLATAQQLQAVLKCDLSFATSV